MKALARCALCTVHCALALAAWRGWSSMEVTRHLARCPAALCPAARSASSGVWRGIAAFLPTSLPSLAFLQSPPSLAVVEAINTIVSKEAPALVKFGGLEPPVALRAEEQGGQPLETLHPSDETEGIAMETAEVTKAAPEAARAEPAYVAALMGAGASVAEGQEHLLGASLPEAVSILALALAGSMLTGEEMVNNKQLAVN